MKLSELLLGDYNSAVFINSLESFSQKAKQIEDQIEMERSLSRIYLNTLALIAKLLGVDEDDEDVITPIEALISERNKLLEQLKDTVSAWEKGNDVFGGIDRARNTIAKAESRQS